MSRTETIIVSLALTVACLLLPFVAFWWGSAAIGMYVATAPDGVIKVSALIGLGVGVVCNILFLRRWVRAFYTADWFLLTAVYLGLSVIALAFCMGVPVGIFGMGVALGVYVGRRLHYRRADGNMASRTLTRGAYFAASLTALMFLPIGLMGLSEPDVARAVRAFGLEPGLVSGPAGPALVAMICLALFALQFFCTRAAGRLAFGTQRHGGQSAGRGDA